MKFQDYLREKSREQQTKHDLENEVIRLQAQLKGEEALNRVLRCAVDCPLFALPFLLSSFPPPVRMLLEELATVEEEILLLERKVKELKLQLYTERHLHQSRDWELHIRKVSRPNLFPSVSGYGSIINEQRYTSHNFQVFTQRRDRIRRVSLGSTLDIHSLFTAARRSNSKPQTRSFCSPNKTHTLM